MFENTEKSLIDRHVGGRESYFIEKYIECGPEDFKAEFGLKDEEWGVIFDYLVFEHGLLQKCALHSTEFFVEAYIENGMAKIREIFGVEEGKYDVFCEVIFDFVAIANEALFYHVMEHRDKYSAVLMKRGADFVRNVLGLRKDKYGDHWAKVLDILLHAVADDMFSERTYEHAVHGFTKAFWGMREQRALVKHKFF